MITARTIQGLGGAIFPLAFGIVRDQFPRERVAFAIAMISGILGIGGGLGIILAGPILDNADYHWLFWIPLVVTLISMVASIFLIPESTIRAPGNVHWAGAALLSGWLIALLVAVSEAPTWGWGSPKTIGLLVLAGVLAALWVWAEARSKHPLVDMQMMRLPGVWTTNLAALLIGFGMYSAFVLIPQFVQTPTSTGYGFGASVTQSGLYLVPSTIALIIFSPIGGRLSTIVGSKVPLIMGSAVTTVSFIVLAVADQSWEIYVASALLGTGIGFAFAALANLIVEAVRPDQTGVASGMNTIVRTIGGAIGAEVAASILVASVVASTGYPTRHGYTVTFVMCAAVLAVAVFASILVPSRSRTRAHVAALQSPPRPPTSPTGPAARRRQPRAPTQQGRGRIPSALEGDTKRLSSPEMCRDRVGPKKSAERQRPFQPAFSDSLLNATSCGATRGAAEGSDCDLRREEPSTPRRPRAFAYVRHLTWRCRRLSRRVPLDQQKPTPSAQNHHHEPPT